MKISVFFNHVREAAKQSGMELGDMLDLVKSWGIDYMEIMLDFDLQGMPEEEFRDMLVSHGFQVSNVAGFFDFAVEPEEYHDFRLIKAAKKLGSKLIMPLPGLYTGNEEKKELELERLVQGFKTVTEAAFDEGITSLVEPFDNAMSPIYTSAGMKYFADHIPNLKYSFDTGNLNFCCDDIPEAYELLKDRISHIHLKDRGEVDNGGTVFYRKDGSPVYPAAVGEGVVPVEWVIRTLETSGYDGIYTLELFNHPEQKTAIEASAKYVIGILNSIHKQ